MAINPTKTSHFLHSLRQSQYTLHVRPEFLTSVATNFVNPRHHVVNTDQVRQTLPVAVVDGLSDENVLALFTKGFFGGFVFGIERTLLRIGGHKILPAKYSTFKTPPDSISIWDKNALPDSHLLPIGSRMFGSFQMLDKYIASATPNNSNETSQSFSYVDYGFGCDTSIFSGCHRFQITRLPSASIGTEAEAEVEQNIVLELQHMRCNPQENRPSVAEYIERFHFLYAKALFADAVRTLVMMR